MSRSLSLLLLASLLVTACNETKISPTQDRDEATDTLEELPEEIDDVLSHDTPDLSPPELQDAPADDADDDGTVTPPPIGPLFPWAGEGLSDAQCSDGIDNDGNGYTDCQDFACSRNLGIFSCGNAAVYENSPAACTDGRDNDGDGLIDCADPDCAKNPYHQVCPPLLRESLCATHGDSDGDGYFGCDDLDCLRDPTLCPHNRKRVLFDQSLDETAALGPNSDWVIDGVQAYPHPSNPSGPNDWAGALSSFAYDLVAQGDFLCETLPSYQGRLSYGDPSNDQDLQHFHILVLIEPSRAISRDEANAIIRFVQAGGGLLLAGNHLGADRDGNGVSAPQALNMLLTQNDVAIDPFGFAFDEVDFDPKTPIDTILAPSHPVLNGPHGVVSALGIFQGCTLHSTGTNPNLVPLLAARPDTESGHDLVAVATTFGAGRVVALVDSATFGDGSDSHGKRNQAHNAYDAPGEQNRAFALNAMAWLAQMP